MEKTKHRRLFKFLAPTNRLIGHDSIDRLVNSQQSTQFDFSPFVHFLLL